MKLNELMIGDLVRCRKGYVEHPVAGALEPFRVSYINSSCSSVAGGVHDAVNVEDLQPIPITPEILLNNGFRDAGADSYLLYVDHDSVEVEKDMYGEIYAHLRRGYDIVRCKFSYVHELQHAIRLCRINKTIEL